MKSLDSAMSRLEHVLFNCKKSEIGFEDLDLLWHGTKKKENYKKEILKKEIYKKEIQKI